MGDTNKYIASTKQTQNNPVWTWPSINCVCISGLGFSMGVLSALSAINRQFPHRYMATVIGLLGTYASVGPIICTTLYDKFFHRGMSYEQQNIRGYFLCLGICSIVIHCAATATYGWPTIWDTDSVNETKHLFPKPQSYHKQHKCANGTTILKEPSTLEDELGKRQHCKELDTKRKTLPQKEDGIADIMYLFRDPRFHLTVWPAGVLTSIKYLGNNNLSVFLRSFKLSKYELLLSYILPMISLVLKPLLGVVADITRHCFSRVWYPLLGGVLLFFSFILAIFYLDHITVFCLVLIFWVMGSEIAFLQPVVHLDDFGKSNFSINMGLLLVSTASCNFLGQLIFGIVYSKRTTDNSICYGLSCFVLTFVAYMILIIPCVIALMVYIALYTKRD